MSMNEKFNADRKQAAGSYEHASSKPFAPTFENSKEYVSGFISDLRTTMPATATVLEEQLKLEIDRVYDRFASQVRNRKLTIRF